jgi:hypothetical protein
MCQLCNLVNLANRRQVNAAPPRTLSTWGTLAKAQTPPAPFLDPQPLPLKEVNHHDYRP